LGLVSFVWLVSGGYLANKYLSIVPLTKELTKIIIFPLYLVGGRQTSNCAEKLDKIKCEAITNRQIKTKAG